MSKFKFITLAASIMLALAFTISCSDDKDDPPPPPPSVDGSLDGSLDGTWQLGNATLEIDGAFFSIEDPEDPSGKFGGPISYDGSRITLTANSYWNGSWQQLPPNLVNTGTISYMLSSNGNTLTISGFPPRDDKYNGAWTKIPDAPQPPPTGGDYLTCAEMQSLLGGDPDAYMNNLENTCKAEHALELQQCSNNRACGENIVFACMSNDEKVKILCGDNSFMVCGEHYDNTCK